MILDALIAQFQQRFQHEKRAQVCLWFDEKGEFTRLIPAPPSFSQRTVPRPWHQETPETAASPILIRLSRPRKASPRLAACRSSGLPPRAGAAAIAARQGRQPAED
jgi:hypothetical protein